MSGNYSVDRGSGEGRCQRIVVVIDAALSAQPAVEKAAQIAAARGGDIELYLRDVQPDIPDSWAGGDHGVRYRDILRARAQQELETLARPLRASGLLVTTRCEWQAPRGQDVGSLGTNLLVIGPLGSASPLPVDTA